MGASIASNNLHATFHQTDLTAPAAATASAARSNFHPLQFNFNGNLANEKSNCKVSCEMNFEKVKNDFDSSNLHSNYPHLVTRASAAHCCQNEMQFGEQIYLGQKLKETTSTSSSYNSNCNVEQLQLLQVNAPPQSSSSPPSSSSSPPSARGDFVCHEPSEFATQQQIKLTANQSSNKFRYNLPNCEVDSFEEEELQSISSRSICKSAPSNLVTILAVVAFVALSATILSNVTVNGKSTIARLEDSLVSSLTFLNSTLEKSQNVHLLPSMTKMEFTSSSPSSGSNVFSKTGGFVFKSFYSTKGAAESLMAALTSLVSSSEKRRAQLASMRSSSSSSSFSSSSSANSSKVDDEQVDEANANSVLDPEEEANLVSVQTACTKFVGTIEDGSFAFKVSDEDAVECVCVLFTPFSQSENHST